MTRAPTIAVNGAPAPADDLERVFRDEYARVISTLVRRFGDLDLAEEAAGEALLSAVRLWPEQGLPPNPGGWLTTTATRRAIDRIRRESTRDHREANAMLLAQEDPAEPVGPVGSVGPVADDRLRLIYICCHPALAPATRVALTLRLVGGLSVPEIAQALLVPETTMAQRLTPRPRSKRRCLAVREEPSDDGYDPPVAGQGAERVERGPRATQGQVGHLQLGRPSLGTQRAVPSTPAGTVTPIGRASKHVRLPV